MLQQALTTTSLLRRLENLEAAIERLQAEHARLQTELACLQAENAERTYGEDTVRGGEAGSGGGVPAEGMPTLRAVV